MKKEDPKKRTLKLANGEIIDLDETFTLEDGTVVKFGEATIEQHEQRIKMLKNRS